MSWLLEPFGYYYMLNAMWVSALVGGVCAFLSCYLMLKGWSLIGDALSHSIVPGVAGPICSACPSRSARFSGGPGGGQHAVFATALAAKEIRIGLIFSSFFGIGLFMVSLNPTSVNIRPSSSAIFWPSPRRILSSWRRSALSQWRFCC